MADSETPTSSNSESTTPTTKRDGGVLARQAARQQAAQGVLTTPPVAPTPDPYAPGGTERRRLRADVLIAVTGPDVDDDATKSRADSLLEWIDRND